MAARPRPDERPSSSPSSSPRSITAEPRPGAGLSLTIERAFPAPPERVWQAITSAEDLACWLVDSSDFEPIVGRRFTGVAQPAGVISGRVVEVDPPRRLSMVWTTAAGDALVVLTVSGNGAGSTLQVLHRVANDEDGWGVPT